MKTVPIRVREDDWKWLMLNRGMGNVPEKIHELVEKKAEVTNQIELGNLDEALRLAHDEVLEVYTAKQREHIETAKKWLH